MALSRGELMVAHVDSMALSTGELRVVGIWRHANGGKRLHPALRAA